MIRGPAEGRADMVGAGPGRTEPHAAPAGCTARSCRPVCSPARLQAQARSGRADRRGCAAGVGTWEFRAGDAILSGVLRASTRGGLRL